MTSKSVTRLHHDLQRLNKAQGTRQKVSKAVKKDAGALKTDKKQLDRYQDRFDSQSGALTRSRTQLTHLVDVKNKALTPLLTEEKRLQKAVAASVDPTTGQGDAALQAQLGNLEAVKADLLGLATPGITAQQAVVATRKAAVISGKLDVKHEKTAVTHDRAALKHAKKSLSTAKARVSADRKKALKDLTPAEYQLGLKATNAARKELGLKKVDHVIRPGPGHVTATMRRLAADAHSVAMSMGGYTSGGLCATGVSRTIKEAMGLSVYGNGNQIDNNLPRSKFKQVHISLADALKIPGLVLTWEHTSTAAGSIYGHTAITAGDGHTSSSDFIERDTLAGNRSRTGLKIFMPIA